MISGLALSSFQLFLDVYICSIAAHERSSSTRVVVVLRIVSKIFKAICVWSDSLGSILGCLVTGTVMEEQNDKKISGEI
jgi:hypothetical protein